MTSATEELRHLLDERGVEHYDGTNGTLWGKDASGYRFSADELASGRMSVHMWCETPEQAVEATLGRGTCRLTLASWDDDACTWGCICSACDAHLEHETGIGYNFCPICGAKVVD